MDDTLLGQTPRQIPAELGDGIAPSCDGTDPVVRRLAEAAREQPALKALMKLVATGKATHRELLEFQRFIEGIEDAHRIRTVYLPGIGDFIKMPATQSTTPSGPRPMKTALVIIDMQRYFAHMMDAPLPHIRRLHTLFRACNWPIVFTQHGHHPYELIPPIKNQLIRKVGPENALIVNTPDWELTPEIWKIAGAAPIVAKNTYDAFERTSLHPLLQHEGVERVVVCGVMTEVCCETTVRSAFVKDYEAWLVSDACGTDDRASQERALESARRLIDNVMTTEEAIERLLAECEDSRL